MCTFKAEQFVEQSIGIIGLVIKMNFVELLTAVADELAGVANTLASSSRLSLQPATFSLVVIR